MRKSEEMIFKFNADMEEFNAVNPDLVRECVDYAAGLEFQIEKMKRCEICNHYMGPGICDMGKSGDPLRTCEHWRFDEWI